MKIIYDNRYAILGGLIIGVMLFLGSINFVKPSKTTDAYYSQAKKYTLNELKKYDGSNPKLPIYIGFEGNIYDVTPGKKYYQAGGPYNYLAGKDSSKELQIIGGDIIKRKYKIIGKIFEN
jgi:predicted heme/steroid binding protein